MVSTTQQVRTYLDGSSVKRYHVMRTLISETVGQHSAEVAFICSLLSPDCRSNLLLAALLHDIPEQATGDVPAQAKWGSSILKRVINDLEVQFIAKFIPNYPELTEEEEQILKYADLLQLCYHACDEIVVGNALFTSVLRRGIEALNGLLLPPSAAIPAAEMLSELERIYGR